MEIQRISLPHLTTGDEIINWIRYFFTPGGSCSVGLKGIDLLIGTGSRTHVPMLSCKKKYRVPAVTCMTPAWPLRQKFDLCFVPQHDRVRGGGNIFVTIGPPNRSRSGDKHDPASGLILIGGTDEKSHIWDNQSILNAVGSLLGEEDGRVWTISTSPRTPKETAAGLAELVSNRPGVLFIPFEDTGPGWIEREYERNQTVWVTADSMSMVFEALSAGCRVGLLPVAWKRRNNKFQDSEDNLSREGYIVTYDEWKSGKASRVLSRPLNEARRCAEEILKRWWPDRLQ